MSMQEGYHLRLGGQHDWHIASRSEDLAPWLKKAGTIMELESGPSSAAQFRIMCADNKDFAAHYPHLVTFGAGDEEKWKYHDMKTVQAWQREGHEEAVCSLDPPEDEEAGIIAMWYLLYPVYRRVIQGGGMPFHSALIEHEGKGVLLAAKGGTGKSTCSRRIPGHWNALCDDEACILTDKAGSYRVHPFPTWSDYLWKQSEKTWNVESAVPLHAVFFIHQAEEDAAEPLGQGEAAIMMNEAATQVWRKYLRKASDELKRASAIQMFENACAMAVGIPAYKLGVRLDGRFWEEIERVLRW